MTLWYNMGYDDTGNSYLMERDLTIRGKNCHQ